MRKATIVRTFVGSLFALGAGIVLFGCAFVAANLDHSLVRWESKIIGFRFNTGGLAAVVIGSVAAFVLVAATVLYVIAWVGAMLNAVRLPESDWFLVVLLTGILGVGLVGMAAYAVGAPDALAGRPAPDDYIQPEDMPRPVTMRR